MTDKFGSLCKTALRRTLIMKHKEETPIPIQDPKAELDQLANHLETVKQRIVYQRKTQQKIEERIAALVGVKEEGTITTRTSTYKISTSCGLTRNLELHDPDFYRAELGDRFDDLISIKLSIKIAEFRRASQEEKAIIMENMIIKPRKTTVKIEPREERDELRP